MPWNLRDDFPPNPRSANVCDVCGSPQRRMDDGRREALLDPNIQIDYEGWMAFCESCIVEAARLVGMLSPDQVAAARAEVVALQSDLAHVEAELEATRSALEALRRLDEVRA